MWEINTNLLKISEMPGGSGIFAMPFCVIRTREDEVLIRESAAFGHSKNVTFSAESFRKLPVTDKPWDMYIGMIAAPMLSKGRWNFKGTLLVLQSEKQKIYKIIP